MAKYIDADLLRKEIEFAKSVYDNPKRVVVGVADAFRQDGRAAMCDDILKKIDSLQQEDPVPNDLEEMADNYEQEFFTDATLGEAFIAGAKWQAEQLLKSSPLPEDTVLFNNGVEEGKRLMMKEAVEGEIQMRYSGCLCAKTIRAINEDKFKLGDKVRIIIVKDDL